MLKIIINILLANILFGDINTKINIFGDETPPYAMKINGELKGSSIEILDLMLKHMKSSQSLKDVTLTNWSRAYSLAEKKKNTMVLSTARTKQREKLFKWVGPTHSFTIGLIALKRRHIKIKTIDDIGLYKIGAILKDVGVQLLVKNGVKVEDIIFSKGNMPIKKALQKMEDNKIDLWTYGTEAFFTYIKLNGLDVNKYEVVYSLKKTELYFAFNKGTNDSLINKWQQALDYIKDNGDYAKIIKKY